MPGNLIQNIITIIASIIPDNNTPENNPSRNIIFPPVVV